MLRLLARFYYTIFGSKKLTRLEHVSLNAWRALLAPSAQEILDTQLNAALFAQHQAMGAKLCFYYPQRSDIPLFRDTSPDLHVATVELGEPDALTSVMNAKLYLHRGLFFSIEFPKRPDRFFELRGMREQSVRILSVVPHVVIV